jgi:hypothetical protein
LERVTDRTPQHAEHDPFAIAQLAADDLRPSERPAVERMAAECRDCATLLADLRAITTATAALPPMPAGLRTRDFRLTEADAARLRTGGWRRRLAGLRSPRFAFMQPLGVAISTLALAGLLITGGGLPFFATTTAPLSDAAPGGATSGGGAAVREAPAAASPMTDTSDGSEFTTRVASEPPASGAPAAAMPAPTDATPVAGSAPQGLAGSPQVETMIGSVPPEQTTNDQGTNADSAPAAPTDVPAPAPGEDQDASSDVQSTPASTTGPDPAMSAGWLALLLGGVVLMLLRPLARRFAR